MHIFLYAGTGVLPVFLFLLALIVLDSYKLVTLRAVVTSILLGALSAGGSYLLNSGLQLVLEVDRVTMTRYVAPLTEEVLKAIWLVFLVRSARVGFAVDAAIHGFAIGAGFAMVENVYYLQALGESNFWTWVVRGFGTAVMHGGTTSIFGMISWVAMERSGSPRFFHFLPGFLAAVGLHSLFNHFMLPPVTSTALLLIVFPVLVTLVFQKSEEMTRTWLGSGFDSDQQLMETIMTGGVLETHVGHYLQLVRTHFPSEVLFDMMALLQLHVELSIRAKGVLMARQAGFDVPLDPTVSAQLEELQFLERSIGKTGMLALKPFLHTSIRDIWEINLLKQDS